MFYPCCGVRIAFIHRSVMDMWSGDGDFYLQLLNSNSDIWWAQHNEHRPVLLRILFYLDHAVFGDRSLLLTSVNVMLLFVVLYVVLLYAAYFLEKGIDRTSFYLLVLLTVFCCSWKQDENVIWGF